MLTKILFFLMFISTFGYSQVCTTMVAYDYMEIYDWSGGWAVGFNGNYYTNAFVSSNVSAAVIGNGNGSSPIEDGYYILPNITGLVSTNTHYLEFRLGSYRFGNPTATTSGTDVGDYVDVQLSTNGGASYVSELRITGNNNALWTYSSTAVASKTASGLLTTFTPAGGGDRTLLGDGYSIIRLTLPSGTTQSAFRLYCRVNSAGEEWWLDNISLYTIGPCVPLPIELVSFNGVNNNEYNYLSWVTATELNNSHFVLERSLNSMDWNELSIIQGNGNSSTPIYYDFKDYEYNKTEYNYYRLKQVDFNGDHKYSNIISILSPYIKEKKLVKTINLDGKEVDKNYVGLVIEIYDDGTIKKIIREKND